MPTANTPANAPASDHLIIGLIAGLLLGAGGGWYIGNMMGLNAGAAAMKEANVQPIQTQATTQAETSNPLEDVKTNPYEDVKTNPFE